MHYIHINKLKKEPIYLQIATSIKKAIDQGILRHNDLLPTESELCERFDISNIVVKNAYQSLVDEHLVKRIRGKGSYVSLLPIIHLSHEKFSDLDRFMLQLNLNLTVILTDVIEPSPKQRFLLKLVLESKVLRIVYVGLKNGFPVLIQEMLMPESSAQVLIQNNSENLFEMWQLYQHQSQGKTKHIRHEISVEAIDKATALVLNCEEHTASHVIYTTVSYDHLPQIMFKTTFPGSHFQIDYNYGVTV